MKLLYAFPEPLPLPKARGIQTAWMVDALCAAGVQVVLACPPSDAGHPMMPLGKNTLPENLELLSLSRHWPFPFQRWHSVARFTGLLQKYLEQIRPDVLFVRHLKLAYRLLQACPHIPLVYEAHEVFSQMAPAQKRKKLATQEAYVLEQAAGVVHISRAVQDALHRQYPKVQPRAEIVLHSGVNLPEAVPEKDWCSCGQHIIYTGSFFGWKGAEDLVAAAKLLPADCRITLVGGDAADLEKLAAQVPAGGAQVVLLPRMPADQVMEHLLKACIAVLPNRAEGVSLFTSPLKLFEYMGAGCALVAADLPSIREVLPGDEAAGWFTPGDPVSLAAAIQSLLNDPDKAMAQGEILGQLAKNYTWQARAVALRDFIQNLPESGTGKPVCAEARP